MPAESGMTPLTGMTASQMAEELRKRATLPAFRYLVTPLEAVVLAFLLEQGARDAERVAEVLVLLDPFYRAAKMQSSFRGQRDGNGIAEVLPLSWPRMDELYALMDFVDAARAGEKQNG